ncbi:MAG: glycine cleavage system protein GcvH [Desulfovibrio sp.]|nr:glycine cleavage system protein GcvH [Desulfovibrio sp.]
MSGNPDNLLYSNSHEWARIEGDVATVGITHFAQEALCDITYVELPQVGDSVAQHSEFGSIESVKAASDLLSPVDGEVIEVNSALENTPELCNSAPYADGWLIRVKLSGQPEGLMDAAAYEEFCATQSH